jgi:hypothetical protein
MTPCEVCKDKNGDSLGFLPGPKGYGLLRCRTCDGTGKAPIGILTPQLLSTESTKWLTQLSTEWSNTHPRNRTS